MHVPIMIGNLVCPGGWLWMTRHFGALLFHEYLAHTLFWLSWYSGSGSQSHLLWIQSGWICSGIGCKHCHQFWISLPGYLSPPSWQHFGSGNLPGQRLYAYWHLPESLVGLPLLFPAFCELCVRAGFSCKASEQVMSVFDKNSYQNQWKITNYPFFPHLKDN